MLLIFFLAMDFFYFRMFNTTIYFLCVNMLLQHQLEHRNKKWNLAHQGRMFCKFYAGADMAGALPSSSSSHLHHFAPGAPVLQLHHSTINPTTSCLRQIRVIPSCYCNTITSPSLHCTRTCMSFTLKTSSRKCSTSSHNWTLSATWDQN
jgi:hypothetical protein